MRVSEGMSFLIKEMFLVYSTLFKVYNIIQSSLNLRLKRWPTLVTNRLTVSHTKISNIWLREWRLGIRRCSYLVLEGPKRRDRDPLEPKAPRQTEFKKPPPLDSGAVLSRAAV